ncbi:MAG: hypothetical protein V3S22_05400, partial [Candidatus Neomarinimicrobiota bacterium]
MSDVTEAPLKVEKQAVAGPKKVKAKNMQMPPEGFRLDLFKTIPGLKRFVTARSFQFLLILPNLLVFIILFMAGIYGTPVGNK